MSSSERRLRVLALLARDGADVRTKRLCEVCVEVTGTSGGGIVLMSDNFPRGPVWTTDGVSARLEDLQFELGEGPCVDAHDQDRPVLEPELARPAAPRWLGFSALAVEAGARAVFGFPLRLGAVRLGALSLYRDAPGPLTDDQHADALVLADVAARAVLVLQVDAPEGTLARALTADADFHHVLHQASGMVSVQLGVTVGEALVRLQAHAFGNGRPLAEVARDVVVRRLRFSTGGGEDDAST